MNDLKLLLIRDILPVAKVEYAQGISPLSVVIHGEKLDQANHIYINDIEVIEFVVISPNKILAQVPASETSSTLRKISVIADVPSVNRNSLLQFEVGKNVRDIRGIERLIQQFCKLLLQTPGTDRFRPTEGGGMMKIIGRDVSRHDSKNLQASVVGAVSRARDQLMARQATDSRIPSDERLLSATTRSVSFDPSTTTLLTKIAVSAVSGKVAVANLSF